MSSTINNNSQSSHNTSDYGQNADQGATESTNQNSQTNDVSEEQQLFNNQGSQNSGQTEDAAENSTTVYDNYGADADTDAGDEYLQKNHNTQNTSSQNASANSATSEMSDLEKQFQDLYNQITNSKTFQTDQNLMNQELQPMVDDFIFEMEKDEFGNEQQDAKQNTTEKKVKEQLIKYHNLSEATKLLRKNLKQHHKNMSQAEKKANKKALQENLKRLADMNKNLRNAKQKVIRESLKQQTKNWDQFASSQKDKGGHFDVDERLLTQKEKSEIYKKNAKFPAIGTDNKEYNKNELKRHAKNMANKAKGKNADKNDETKKQDAKKADNKSVKKENLENKKAQQKTATPQNQSLENPSLNEYQVSLKKLFEDGRITESQMEQLVNEYANKQAKRMQGGAVLTFARDEDSKTLFQKVFSIFYDDDSDSQTQDSQNENTKNKKTNYRQFFKEAFSSLNQGNLATLAHTDTAQVFTTSRLAENQYSGNVEEGIRNYRNLTDHDTSFSNDHEAEHQSAKEGGHLLRFFESAKRRKESVMARRLQRTLGLKNTRN